MEDMRNYRVRWEKPVEHTLKNLGYKVTIYNIYSIYSIYTVLCHHSTHPDVERQVGAVEEHDVAGEGMLAVLPRHAPPAHLLVSPALDFSATEKPEHVGPAWWRPARRR